MKKKNQFNSETMNKNVNAARMLRKNDNKFINLDLEENVDPIHIKKEEISAWMKDCAIDVQGPTLEVEGQDLIIPVDEQVIKAGRMKVKFDLGGVRMNQTTIKTISEMMGGFLKMIPADLWDQRVKDEKEKAQEDKPVDGFDPVE